MRSLMQNKKKCLFIYGVSFSRKKKLAKKLFAKNYHAVLYLIISQFCMLKKSQLKIEKQAQKVKKLFCHKENFLFFGIGIMDQKVLYYMQQPSAIIKKVVSQANSLNVLVRHRSWEKLSSVLLPKLVSFSHNSFTTNTYPWYYYCNMVTPKVFFLQIRNCPLPLSWFLYVMVYHSHHLSLYLMIIWSNEIVAVEKTLKLHSIKDRL